MHGISDLRLRTDKTVAEYRSSHNKLSFIQQNFNEYNLTYNSLQ